MPGKYTHARPNRVDLYGDLGPPTPPTSGTTLRAPAEVPLPIATRCGRSGSGLRTCRRRSALGWVVVALLWAGLPSMLPTRWTDLFDRGCCVGGGRGQAG
jgi:hypothetical protein